MWQDVLLLVGNFVFAGALLPSVVGKEKPPLFTCGLTALILAFYVVAFVSLGLVLATVGTGLTFILWFILTIQQFRKKNRLLGGVSKK